MTDPEKPARRQAWAFAAHWVEAWNAGIVDAVVELCADGVEYSTGTAESGELKGKRELRAFLERVAGIPALQLRLVDVFVGPPGMAMTLERADGVPLVVAARLDRSGHAKQVWVYHSARRSAAGRDA